MTESREELIEAMQGLNGRSTTWSWEHALDALLAHPGAVLAELENAPCQTCGGDKFMRDAYGRPTEDDCSACGGSGILGRDGLLRHYGMERATADQCGAVAAGFTVSIVDGAPLYRASPVPVPEPSEGTPNA